MGKHSLLLPVLLAFLAGASPAHAWTWPASGPVLQHFSYNGDPYAAGQHRGVDVGGSAGEPVLAPAAGGVTFAGTVPGGGRTVTIRTPGGLAVTLLHLGTITEVKGASVAEGAQVGTLGSSGTSEWAEPYVHLGIRQASDEGGYLDPESFLPPRVSAPETAVEAEEAEADAEPTPSESPAAEQAGPASGQTSPVTQAPAPETEGEQSPAAAHAPAPGVAAPASSPSSVVGAHHAAESRTREPTGCAPRGRACGHQGVPRRACLRSGPRGADPSSGSGSPRQPAAANLRSRKEHLRRVGLLRYMVRARPQDSWPHFSRASLHPAASPSTGSVEGTGMRTQPGIRRPRCPTSCLPGGWKLGASAADAWSKCPLVGLERGIDHPLPAARASDAFPPFSAKLGPEVGVGEQTIDRGAERERISRRHEESCDLMLDELGEPANRTRHDGPAVRHRFRTGEPETLPSRGADDDCRAVIEVGEFVA